MAEIGEWLVTVSYMLVPLWLMWMLHAVRFRWDIFGLVVHLSLVGVRRSLVHVGLDDPALWATVHGWTITAALAGVLIEMWRYRQQVRLLKGDLHD